MYNAEQQAKKKKKKSVTRIFAFTLSLRSRLSLGPSGQWSSSARQGRPPKNGSRWWRVSAGLCGSEQAATKGSRIRHNSCHAQISDIFSSSVACVTLATPLRQQMGRQTSACALPNANPVLNGFFIRALGRSHVRRRHKQRRLESSRLLRRFFFWHFWRVPLTPFYSNHWSSPQKIPQVLSSISLLAAAWGQHIEPCEALDADYVPCLKTNFLKQGRFISATRGACAAGRYY